MNISNPFIKKALDKFSVVEYKKSLIESLNPNLKETKDYQVIILAAGKGSRMNIDYPKTLHKLPYPRGEVCIFQNLLEGLDNLKSQTTIKDIKVVINKESKGFFQSLEESVKFKIIELNESQIRGTAVCINEIKKDIKKNQEIIILWGDYGNSVCK